MQWGAPVGAPSYGGVAFALLPALIPITSRTKAGPGVLLFHREGKARDGDGWEDTRGVGLSGGDARDGSGLKSVGFVAHRGDAHADGGLTAGKGSRGSEEELVVAGLAVHLVGALAEGALVQLAQAVGADEVLGVVLAASGRHAAARHGAPAAVAHAALPLVEVGLAVGPALQLEEGAAGEASQAILGGEKGTKTALARLGGCLLLFILARPHSPRRQSTRGARRPVGPTGSCPSRAAHSLGTWGRRGL